MEKKLDAEAMLRELIELRACVPGNGETDKKLDAETILRKLAEMRQSIPGIEHLPPSGHAADGRTLFLEGVPAETEEDFEYAAVMDALESFAEDIRTVGEQAAARAVESALQVYYTAEELAHDPANAELIPWVQKMREAYERDFGKPIPPREPRDE